MRPGSGFRLKIGHKSTKNNDVKICRHDVIINVFDVVMFLLSRLVTGPNFMSIS